MRTPPPPPPASGYDFFSLIFLVKRESKKWTFELPAITNDNSYSKNANFRSKADWNAPTVCIQCAYDFIVHMFYSDTEYAWVFPPIFTKM